MSETTDTTEARTFWMEMQYGCDKCGYETPVLLEEGLEGPRDKDIAVPYAMIKRNPHFLPEDVPDTIPATASGRVVLPVPFVAWGCPHCQPGGPPWRMDGGVLSHVRWNEDREFASYRTKEPDVPHLRYPADPYAENACGEPVWVDAPHRRNANAD